jgi:RimJ/RimL family protein N-acetyltransferase
MTNNKLNYYINFYNKEKSTPSYIDDVIDIIQICKDKQIDKIYLIKKDGTYIGAVYDMGVNDLHAYMKKDYRKKGYMSNALKNHILPYLFSRGREYQHITYYSDNISAKYSALKIGFIEVGKTKDCRVIAYIRTKFF